METRQLRQKIKYFVSYAHSNRELANKFLEQLDEVFSPSKKYAYVPWRDTQLVIGKDWENQIQEAIATCNFGLLLISPAFLGSKFIIEKELPLFATGKKPQFL